MPGEFRRSKRNAQIQLATNLDAADRQRRGDQDTQDRGGRGSQGHRSCDGAPAISKRGPQEVSPTCAQEPIRRASINLPSFETKKTNLGLLLLPRGICEERSKQWSKAEADMRKALDLQPEQPHVLKLSRLFLDRSGAFNLDEGMKIDQGGAVDQRPDDGLTFVDYRSVGAYYRIGNFEDAVKKSRASDRSQARRTRPSTDHLGRRLLAHSAARLEAKFQWAHARDLKPEPEELPKIEAKIEERPARRSRIFRRQLPRTRKKEDGKGG